MSTITDEARAIGRLAGDRFDLHPAIRRFSNRNASPGAVKALCEACVEGKADHYRLGSLTIRLGETSPELNRYERAGFPSGAR